MVRRQRTAFPPNFVHSLDGSHMMMTAVACQEAGMNFAGSFFLSLSLSVLFYVLFLFSLLRDRPEEKGASGGLGGGGVGG